MKFGDLINPKKLDEDSFRPTKKQYSYWGKTKTRYQCRCCRPMTPSSKARYKLLKTVIRGILRKNIGNPWDDVQKLVLAKLKELKHWDTETWLRWYIHEGELTNGIPCTRYGNPYSIFYITKDGLLAWYKAPKRKRPQQEKRSHTTKDSYYWKMSGVWYRVIPCRVKHEYELQAYLGSMHNSCRGVYLPNGIRYAFRVWEYVRRADIVPYQDFHTHEKIQLDTKELKELNLHNG
jgi:hypothetical protein